MKTQEKSGKPTERESERERERGPNWGASKKAQRREGDSF